MKSKRFTVYGTSVKDACSKAKDLLKEGEFISHFDIIDEGRRGFLGFFRRPAILEVIIETNIQEENLQKQFEEKIDGTAEVKEGVLRIYGPENGGEKAIIIPTIGASLRINGVAIHGSRLVGDEDEYEVELFNETTPAEVEVEVSDDGLIAKVKVTPEINIYHELVEQEKQNILQLLTKEHIEKKNVITFEEVEEALRANGVMYGIDYDAIEKAVANADGEWEIVARGEPVTPGKDGYVENLFNTHPVEIIYSEEEWADFWERFTYPGVREGEVLAVLHPPQQGSPGKTVTGEDILPEPAKEAVLLVKDGVKISDDGRKAIATTYGRPVLDGRREKHLKIVQLMIHPGNVDIKSGNLRYDGDLMILGNVNEGMTVTANGDIKVKGNAIKSVIQAGGKVYCQGNLIGSKVRAGGLKSFYNRVIYLLKEAEKIFDWIIEEAIRIREYSLYNNKYNIDYLIQIVDFLVRHNKSDLDKFLEEYTFTIEKEEIPFPPVITKIADEIKLLISRSMQNNALVLDGVESILKQIKDTIYSLTEIPDNLCDISCSYVENSILETTCSINIFGKGCYQSSLIAGKKIKINGNFRGGEMFAIDDIFIDEVGTPGNSVSRVKIKTSEKANVFLNKAHPETFVQIGKHSFLIENKMEKVKFFLGEKGIELTNF